MSLLKKVKKVVKKAAKGVKSVAKVATQQALVSASAGSPLASAVVSSIYAPKSQPVTADRITWANPFSTSNPINAMATPYQRNPMGPSLRGGTQMSVIKSTGSLPGVGYAAGRAVGTLLKGARGLPGTAGLAAAGLSIVGGMIIDAATGQVVGKAPRRRAKGITGAQLKAFYRVNSLLNKVCKTAPPISRRGSSRGKRPCR